MAHGIVELQGDEDMTALRQRQPRQHVASHLAFIRKLPCVICQNNVETQAAHVRMSDSTVAKPYCGIAMKPDDMFTVPLCGAHHNAQHKHGNEREWWRLMDLDPVKIALALYVASGDYERGCEIVAR